MAGWTRNRHGVKDGAECYRTINGARWEWWPENIELFRTAGCRCRKMPDGQGCFVHPDDTDKAFAAVSDAPTKEPNP